MTIHQQPRVAVTGGTSGLGLALVREFLARGAQVALVARGLDRLEQIAYQHSGAHPIAGDVSVKDDIRAFYATDFFNGLRRDLESGGTHALGNRADDAAPNPLAGEPQPTHECILGT